MQYILTEDEYNDLLALADSKGRIRKETHQMLCTRVAEYMPVFDTRLLVRMKTK